MIECYNKYCQLLISGCAIGGDHEYDIMDIYDRYIMSLSILTNLLMKRGNSSWLMMAHRTNNRGTSPAEIMTNTVYITVNFMRANKRPIHRHKRRRR